MSERSSFLSGLSTFQVVAGALAAMTSAWVASTLGVAGTIIGAALGSLVVSITSAFYANTLHRGRTLVVQTADGKVVERRIEDGDTAEALAQVEDETDADIKDAHVTDDESSAPPWRRIVISTVVVLLIALLAIVGYEQVSDRSFGSNSENARVTNPFGGGTSTGGDGSSQDGGTGDDSGSNGGGGTGGDPYGDSRRDGNSQNPSGGQTDPTPTPSPTTSSTPTPTQQPTPTPTPTEAPE